MVSCNCGPFECNCRWRPQVTSEGYAAPAWTPPDAQSYASYAPSQTNIIQQTYDPSTIATEDIFHPEEIFQLDQPLRMEFPAMDEQSTMESPPTFADLNGDSRSEDSYWFDWQRAPEGSETSQTPSPELFGNHYQQEPYCEQQSYPTHGYYPEEAQYFNSECSRTSPMVETDQLRYYRWNSSDCSQTNLENQMWTGYDCSFVGNEAAELRQPCVDMPQQSNTFSGNSYN